MNQLNWEEVSRQVQDLAITVGQIQLANLGRDDLAIDTKSTGIDLVTEIDKQSEAMILEFLRQHYPDHGIMAEESGETARDSDYLWIIDPLDGTTNYSQGLPVFAVSIALQYQGETVIGVVYAPGVNQLFSAIKGQGAWLNGKRITVSRKTQLTDCVLATGFPYDVFTHQVNNLDYFGHFLVRTRAIRRLGAAAYDLACVACGKFDGYWEMGLQPWDAAAGVLLIEEAGGKVTAFRHDRKLSLAAANPELCDTICAQLEQAAKPEQLTV